MFGKHVHGARRRQDHGRLCSKARALCDAQKSMNHCGHDISARWPERWPPASDEAGASPPHQRGACTDAMTAPASLAAVRARNPLPTAAGRLLVDAPAPPPPPFCIASAATGAAAAAA